MKGIHTLIKLSKRTLDELRRQMVVLENQKNTLQKNSLRLQEELKAEQELAKTQVMMSGFFGGFAKRIKTRQAEIAADIVKLEREMATLSDAIAVAFSELKKYEIARENSKRRERAKEDRRDTIMLDEIAGQQHSRKNKEEA